MRSRAPKPRPWTVALLCLALPALPHGLRLRARDRLLELQAGIGRGLGEPGVLAPPDPHARAESNLTRKLEAQVEQLRRLLREAGAANEVLERGSDLRTIPALAYPLARGSDLLQRVVLDRGLADGVREGQVVLCGEALVGRVARALDTRCEVLLVTDPQFQVRCTIPRPEGDLEGILRGDGSPMLVFQPAVDDPAAPAPLPRVGEAVHTSRQSLLCAVPVPAGSVEEVVRLPGVPQPVARVLPAFDPDRLERVVILQGGGLVTRALLLLSPLWVVALRQTLPETLGWSSLAPDVFLLAAAVAAWRHAPIPAVLFAAAGGALLDVPSAIPFGLGAGRVAVCAALFATLRRAVRTDVPGAGALVVTGFALLERIAMALELRAFDDQIELAPLLLRAGTVAVVTGLCAPFGFLVSRLLKPGDEEKKAQAARGHA